MVERSPSPLSPRRRGNGSSGLSCSMRIDGSRVGTSKTILARLVEARDGHVGFAMFRAVMVEAATALWLKLFDDGYLG